MYFSLSTMSTQQYLLVYFYVSFAGTHVDAPESGWMIYGLFVSIV